jgi:prepilin-type N-terminal cleavage/methylation domain-containing protein
MVQKNEKGFTLIELLVVIAIIGILAAVAIPQFSQYRDTAFCAQVESDVANAMIAMEGGFASSDPPTYPVDPAAAGFTGTIGVQVTATLPTLVNGLIITGTRTDTNLCSKGTTFTLEQGGTPLWV